MLQNVLKEKHGYNILMFTTLQFNNLFFSTVNLILTSVYTKKNGEIKSYDFLCHNQQFYYIVKYLFELHLKIL